MEAETKVTMTDYLLCVPAFVIGAVAGYSYRKKWNQKGKKILLIVYRYYQSGFVVCVSMEVYVRNVISVWSVWSGHRCIEDDIFCEDCTEAMSDALGSKPWKYR